MTATDRDRAGDPPRWTSNQPDDPSAQRTWHRLLALLALLPVLLLPACEKPVRYANCEQARAAGAAPIHQGQPGYRAELDGNGDGIACEET